MSAFHPFRTFSEGLRATHCGRSDAVGCCQPISRRGHDLVDNRGIRFCLGDAFFAVIEVALANRRSGSFIAIGGGRSCLPGAPLKYTLFELGPFIIVPFVAAFLLAVVVSWTLCLRAAGKWP